jgi:hypothetical protein
MAAEHPVNLKRVHAQRLREVYRSAGWPYQDTVEIELLAAGLLERVNSEQGSGQGPELVRVTQAGLVYLAGALAGNRQARSAHEALVGQVAQAMLRDGRLVWTALGAPRVPNCEIGRAKFRLQRPQRLYCRLIFQQPASAARAFAAVPESCESHEGRGCGIQSLLRRRWQLMHECPPRLSGQCHVMRNGQLLCAL